MGRIRVRLLAWTLGVLAAGPGGLRLGAAGTPPPPKPLPPPAPKDLRLTPENAAWAEALAHYAWGVYLRAQGKNAESQAPAQFLAAIRANPNAAPALEALVAPWILHRDFRKIVRVLRPLAQEHPRATALQLVVAEALAAQKRLPEATALIERALRASRWSDPQLFRQLFVYYWQQKKFDKIETLLRRARRAASIRDRFVVLHANAVYWTARAHTPAAQKSRRLRRRCRKRALEWARKAAAALAPGVRPQDAVSLARIFISQHRPNQAAAILQRYSNFRPKIQDPAISLLLAGVLLDQKKNQDAIAVLDPLLRRPWLSPQAAVELGRLYIRADALDKAAVAYEKILAFRPNLTRLRLTLAYLYLQLKRPKRAIELVRAVKQPQAQIHYLLSHAYHDLHDLKKAGRELMLAADAARKARDKQFFSVDYYLYSATLLEEMGLTDRAIEEAEKALKLSPDDPTCLNFVGYVLADHNRELPRAERLIRRALDQAPRDVAFLDSLAWVLYRHRTLEALGVMNHCLELAGANIDPIIFEHAGDINRAAGYPIMARRYWWGALEAGPDPADRPRIRKKLQQAVSSAAPGPPS